MVQAVLTDQNADIEALLDQADVDAQALLDGNWPNPVASALPGLPTAPSDSRPN